MYKFTLKKETEVINPQGGESKKELVMYIVNNNLEMAVINTVDSVEEFIEKTKPENINELLTESLSEDEYETFSEMLESGTDYKVFDQVLRTLG